MAENLPVIASLVGPSDGPSLAHAHAVSPAGAMKDEGGGEGCGPGDLLHIKRRAVQVLEQLADSQLAAHFGLAAITHHV